MRDINTIKHRINILKLEINRKIAESDDLNNSDILILSKRLDILINQWQKHYAMNKEVY
ncbi:MAG: hypothetical protein K0R50_4516 [Eubacterium sp.]|nr:hypothetical protein [Eubacterium sp.]